MSRAPKFGSLARPCLGRVGQARSLAPACLGRVGQARPLAPACLGRVSQARSLAPLCLRDIPAPLLVVYVKLIASVLEKNGKNGADFAFVSNGLQDRFGKIGLRSALARSPLPRKGRPSSLARPCLPRNLKGRPSSLARPCLPRKGRPSSPARPSLPP